MATTLPVLTADALTAAAAEYAYERMGLRIVDELPEDGETLAPSRVWVDGEPTGDVLPGTCAIRLDDAARALDRAAGYVGSYAVLIGSDSWQHGEDDGEIVLRDAIVLARFVVARG